MNKKPFWKRCNRGFVVSMALLAATVLYILIGQIMLIPDNRSIQKLAEEYRGYMENTTFLTEDQISSFSDNNSNAKKDESEKLKTELTPSFVDNSSYLDAAVQNLIGNIQVQTGGAEHIKTHGDAKTTKASCMIDQDVATYTAVYSYTVSGDFMNYSTGSLQTTDNVKKNLQMTVICKKVNGEWKLYRVSQAVWQTTGQTTNGGAKS